MPLPGKRERLILTLATMASFFVPYLTSSITVALPVIGREFSLDAVSLGWVMSSYILATAVCIVPLGRIADIYGRKKLFEIGITLLTAGSLFSAFAWSASSLIFFRIIQGAGGAMIFTTSVAIVTAVFQPERRGWALGITLASVYGGLSTGPFIGGILTGFLGWRSIFLVIVPPGIAVLWLTIRYVDEEWSDARGASFDLIGSFLYAAALFGIMYGMSLVPDPSAFVWIFMGVALLVAFLWWGSHRESPVLDIGVFRHNATFTFSNLAALINYASTYAVAFLLSLYLQYTKGLSPEAAGLVLVAQPVVQTVFSPAAGRLSDRIEPRVVASVGMALTAVGLLIFSFLAESTTLVLIVPVLFLMGSGYALFSSPNTNAIMSSVAPHYYGVASSMVATMRAIGQLTSMAIAMMIFSLVMGRVEVTSDVYPRFLVSVQLVFLVLFVMSVLGVLASLSRGKIRVPSPQDGGKRNP
jgi:EmrB/QacA subfamily drug resistance transporter